MSQAAFTRQYVILRPVSGCAGGFVRLEAKQGRRCIAVRVTQAPAGNLRLLLLAGPADTGAVTDLGLMRLSPRRQASLYREDLPSSCLSCHTAVICTDWPDAQVVLYGYLTPKPALTHWQLQEAVQAYLSVPARDCVLPEPAEIVQEPPRLTLCMLLRPR